MMAGDFSVRGRQAAAPRVRGQRLKKSRVADYTFFLCLIAYPVAQFCVFYIGVNYNSILLAFQRFDTENARFVFWGFGNFKAFVQDIFNSPVMKISILNSVKIYLVTLLIGLPLNLFFSYFIYKKVPLSGFFRVVLFLPQILSAIVMSLMFKFFMDRGLPGLLEQLGMKNIPVFLVDRATAFPMIIFYCLWSGFGAQVIIYSSSMARIPHTLIEYGKLEGISMLREFFTVTLPLIFPTMITFLVAGVAGLFTNQAQVFNFFGASADFNLYTLGYYLFIKVVGGESSFVDYPYASAGGLIFTLVAVPVTLGVKYMLERINPTTEY